MNELKKTVEKHLISVCLRVTLKAYVMKNCTVVQNANDDGQNSRTDNKY
jgi:hypothetical protein